MTTAPAPVPATAPRVVPPGQAPAHDVLGSPTIIHLPSSATGGRFALVELRGGTGVGIPTHTHAGEDETFHVLEGTVRFTVGGASADLGPGGTAFGPRAVPHAWQVTEGPARILMVLSPGGMEAMFPELGELTASGRATPEAVAGVCARFGVTFA